MVLKICVSCFFLLSYSLDQTQSKVKGAFEQIESLRKTLAVIQLEIEELKQPDDEAVKKPMLNGIFEEFYCWL